MHDLNYTLNGLGERFNIIRKFRMNTDNKAFYRHRGSKETKLSMVITIQTKG